MKHLWLGIFAAVMLLPATALRAQDNQDEKTDPPAKKADSGDEAAATPAEQFKALVAEYQTGYQKWLTEARAASLEGKAVDMTSRPNPQAFAGKFLALAEKTRASLSPQMRCFGSPATSEVAPRRRRPSLCFSRSTRKANTSVPPAQCWATICRRHRQMPCRT